MNKKKTDSFDLSSFLPKTKKTSTLPKETKEEDATISTKSDNGSISTIDVNSEKTETRSREEHEQQENTMKTATIDEVKVSGVNEEELYQDDDAENDTPPMELPIAYSATLKEHTRAISAVAIDPSCARVVTGSYDYHLKFWDFNGMDRSLKSFRSILPWEGYQFWGRGDRFLVVSGATGAKMYDRDGFLQAEYHKGDPYIRDMKKTTGHIAGITCAEWHPVEKNMFMTAGLDSTIRIWDSEVYRNQRFVVVARGASGHRLSASINSAAFSSNGALVFGARLDGGLTAWDWRNAYLRPKLHIDNAHAPGTETSRIAVSSDGFTIVTRGGDSTVKLWDTRLFTKPVKTVSGLPNRFPETDVIFSPDERYVVTGTSVLKGQGQGKMMFFDRYSMELKKSIDMAAGSVIRLVWNSSINQIVAGCSDGSSSIFYDPTLSSRGILQSVTKAPKIKSKDAYSNVEYVSYYELTNISGVYLPNALPMFQEGDDFNNERASRQKDKKLSHRPEPPKITMYGPGRHGKIGSGDTQTLLSLLGKNEIRDEDPREALLKLANVTEKDPKFIAHVYKKTQPKAIFDMTRDEMEEQRDVKRRK